MTSEQQRISEAVDGVVTAAGYDLEDVTVQPAGRRRLVRVIVDSDRGVSLDEAARISRELSARLDELGERGSDPLGSAPYTLEVSSPGIGRPLTLPRHFRRAAGRLLTVTLADGTTLTGRVRVADDSGVEVLTGRDGLTARRLGWPEIDRARVEVEFSKPSAAVLAALGDTAQVFTGDGSEVDEHDGSEVDDGEDDDEVDGSEVDELDDDGTDDETLAADEDTGGEVGRS